MYSYPERQLGSDNGWKNMLLISEYLSGRVYFLTPGVASCDEVDK